MRHSSVRPVIIAVVGALVAGTMIAAAVAGPASAHVRISATDATQGGYGVLTFRVPNESDTASTTAVIVNFPDDTPIRSVSVLPVTGWTATPETKKLTEPVRIGDGEIDSYVSRLVWKADSARYAIKPGEFGMFSISAGPLPHRDSIAFPTVQRYSDGTSVSWNEIAAGSGAEPEHPAPTVQLAAADNAESPAGSSTGQPAAGSQSGTRTAAGSAGWWAPVTIALAAIAIVMSAIALLRSRRQPG